MAGTDTSTAGAPHPGTPVWPPRRVLSPGPAAAPGKGGRRPNLGSADNPAQRHVRLERLLWLLVAAVAVAGSALIVAMLTSGSESSAVRPPADAVLPQADVVTERPRAHSAPPVTVRIPAGWSEVARGFGLAFTRTGAGRDAWFAAMSSWLTTEQADQYRDVAVEAIPRGELVEVDVADPGSAMFTRATLTYDTGMVLELGLSYAESAGGWRVARVSLAGHDSAGR